MASASDNFNRADSGTLGANWGAISTLSGFKIVSNQAVQATTGSNGGNRYTAVTFGNDQFSQITIAADPNNFNYGGPCIRAASGAITYYGAGFDSFNSGNTRQRIWKVVATTWTSLAASSSVNIAQNDVVYLQAVGNALTMKVNGSTVLTATDSAIASGQPGFQSRSPGNQATFDDWSAADIVSGNLLHPASMSGIHGRYLSEPMNGGMNSLRRIFDMGRFSLRNGILVP